MSKKRKSDATRLDEMDRSMYNTFCSAANSLSHLYSQAMNHQPISFQAGERHALNELDYGAEESPMSPRPSFHQNPQTTTFMNALNAPFSSTIGHGARSGDYEGKTSEFSNAIHQVGYHSNNVVSSSADGPRNHETSSGHQQNGEANSSIFNDYMDMPMHADSLVYE